MKNINIKNISKNSILPEIDAIAAAKKNKKFKEYYRRADARLKLAVEIYNARERLRLNQQQLAKEIHTTQKVISNIENGDVNVGFDLLYRIRKRLNINTDKIFGCDSCVPVMILNFTGKNSKHENVDLYTEDSLAKTNPKTNTINE
ncbi:MAG: helix-turn-helix transcriptional regulator [Candidatus Staskawiczbacteria bacterium]|nr:helix-turn-helix transcriptional regulator [Candidatus Staskawiczbacteria bacterium]